MREPADRWEPKNVPGTNVGDMISRWEAIDWLNNQAMENKMYDTYEKDGDPFLKVRAQDVHDMLESLPSVEPQISRRFTNKEWIDFLVSQFDISRTSAKDMLHGMMWMKKEDNFKRTFNPRGDKHGSD